MPIRPENKARYPANWRTEIVPRIRARSGNRCECTGQCGLRHSFVGLPNGRCHRRNGEPINDITTSDGERFDDGGPRIVLTVMHLNHQPEDCRDENLLHGCQGCHLRYDAPRKHAEMKARRHAERASGDLFQCEETA